MNVFITSPFSPTSVDRLLRHVKFKTPSLKWEELRGTSGVGN